MTSLQVGTTQALPKTKGAKIIIMVSPICRQSLLCIEGGIKMAINTQCKYDAMLGLWKDRGFTLREIDDPIDETDKLVVLQYRGTIVGSYYRSKLMHAPIINGIPAIQIHCQKYWDSLIGLAIGG